MVHKPQTMLNKLLNYALFQGGWYVSLVAAAHGWPAAALGAAGAAIGVSLWLCSADRAGDFRLLLAAALIGFCVESVNLWLGVYSLAGAPRFLSLCPLWLAAQWPLFATTLRGSLSWLAGRYGLSALLGAIWGPLTYVAGEKLGAASLSANRAFSVAALAVVWAAMTPLLVWLAGRSSRRPSIK
jgi:hypothetical protein